MPVGAEEVLPYRSGREELDRWIEARARGRDANQIRNVGFPSKTFEGTVATTRALGLVKADGDELTDAGRKYALSSAPERDALLREEIRRFPPYARLLRAALARGAPPVTETAWMERWWATHGFGSSESNRTEAATLLGKLCESAELGTFIPGRRGHPSRVEWSPGALVALSLDTPPTAAATNPSRAAADDTSPMADRSTNVAEQPSSAARAHTKESQDEIVPPAYRPKSDRQRSVLHLVLQSGEVSRIEVPSVMSAVDKRRLLTLLDLAVTVSDNR